MPRGGRVLLPHCPHHIVHRGHNRRVVFAQDTDFQRYLADLRELKDAFGVKVYAYCLMTNHVHLLLVPDDACAGLSQLMKTLAARATRYRNRLEGLPVHCGKVVLSPALCSLTPTCWLVAATSN